MTDGCDKCDFDFVLRLPDGSLVIVAAGQLKPLDENMCYDETVKEATFGFFVEYVGGNIGKLSLCAREKFPDIEEVEVLIEGRWRKLRLI